MNVINMYQAKTTLSQLVARAVNGEEIIIAKAGKPLVKLVKYDKPLKKRVPGLWKGKVWISDDFDAEDPEINKLFYGE